MTEDEAKTKWCPFARTHWKGAAVNRAFDHSLNQSADPLDFYSANCIGSACMAWRWIVPNADRFASYDPDEPGGCGLAGAPQ